MTFVAIGCRAAPPLPRVTPHSYEHSIANMFLLTTGLLYQGPAAPGSPPPFTFFDVVFRNLVPATVGNIIGGGGLVAGVLLFAYRSKPDAFTSLVRHSLLSELRVRHSCRPPCALARAAPQPRDRTRTPSWRQQRAHRRRSYIIGSTSASWHSLWRRRCDAGGLFFTDCCEIARKGAVTRIDSAAHDNGIACAAACPAGPGTPCWDGRANRPPARGSFRRKVRMSYGPPASSSTGMLPHCPRVRWGRTTAPTPARTRHHAPAARRHHPGL